MSKTKSSAKDRHCPAPDVATRARTGLGDSGEAVGVAVKLLLGVSVGDAVGVAVCDAVIEGEVPNDTEAELVAVYDDVIDDVGCAVALDDGVDVDVKLGVGGKVGTCNYREETKVRVAVAPEMREVEESAQPPVTHGKRLDHGPVHDVRAHDRIASVQQLQSCAIHLSAQHGADGEVRRRERVVVEHDNGRQVVDASQVDLPPAGTVTRSGRHHVASR